MPYVDGQRQHERAQATALHAVRHIHLAESSLLRGDYRATVVAVVAVASALDDLTRDLGVEPESVL